eukprot:TRINITY_DN29424_c0_g1_i1.p1 TRINITY_DN29424_c0_g1~~TRINITY_DN29424_c0_g1_i1.p1  ORF type:complete len:572 (+),score=115.71 TRINITY_DN29424_c0_g1_i1:107-1822(+)
MGLLRFRNRKASCALDANLRRKINVFSSLGLGTLVLLTFITREMLDRRARAHGLTSLSEFEGAARRLNETEAESSLYPKDLLLNEPYFEEPVGKKFLALFHVVGMVYMLLGLNKVCDCYFAGSIDNLCEAWQLTPDVAGATWMAAGGSAPELFTSLIGATIAQNDVGFGTIVGSAVFNVLFVIGLCGYVAKGNIDLTWWPLFRDCTYYIISLGVLAAFTYNQMIVWWEALILFIMYLGYVSIMFVNKPLNLMAYQLTNTPLSEDLQEYKDSKDCSTAKVAPESVGSGEGESEKTGAPLKDNLMVPDKVTAMEDEKTDAGTSEKEDSSPVAHQNGNGAGCEDMKEIEAKGGDAEEENDDDEPENFMERPEGALDMTLWVLTLPVYACLYFTLPWPSKGSKLYMLCFALSLLWIAGFSFLLVWWTEIVGAVIGVPTILMGLTVLAAGTSIPDAVSSMAVARKGQADMAVSSSIGSNIFDILVGLPVPWMVKCAIESGNADFLGVTIKSPYLMFYVLLLLGMVFAVIVSIKLCKWKLTKGLGACMAGLYLLFIVAAIVVDTLKPRALMTNPPDE